MIWTPRLCIVTILAPTTTLKDLPWSRWGEHSQRQDSKVRESFCCSAWNRCVPREGFWWETRPEPRLPGHSKAPGKGVPGQGTRENTSAERGRAEEIPALDSRALDDSPPSRALIKSSVDKVDRSPPPHRLPASPAVRSGVILPPPACRDSKFMKTCLSLPCAEPSRAVTSAWRFSSPFNGLPGDTSSSGSRGQRK